AARYHLALAEIQAGRREAGLAAWRALVSELPPGDPRRAALQAEIAAVASGRRPEEAAEAGTEAMIQGMVDGLAARLAEQPVDPAGWARLVRAYAVLGDREAQTAALERARAL